MKIIELGKVVNVHGVHGEIKVNPYTDSPDFFKNFSSLMVDGKSYNLKGTKVAKGCAVLKLEGVDTVEAAELLRGKDVTVPEDMLPPPPKGRYYIKDLEGLNVFADGSPLGTLTEVMQTGANDVYVVVSPEGKEYLIPVVKEFVKKVDIENGRVEITHIRGITYDED